MVSALRVSNEIERIGDLAKNIGKRVLDLNGEYPSLKLIRGVEHMGSLVLTQLKQVLDAYAARDVEEAMEVWRRDEEIDAMCVSLFRELLTYMMEDPRSISFCIHLLFSAKNIERMGDHATNIAETVHYMIEGVPLALDRPKADTDEFLSHPNAGITEDHDERPELAHPDCRRRRAVVAAASLQPRVRGLRGRHVGRGDDADTRLRERTPDLVVLDWMLPGLSGIELCRRLRSRPETKSLPIIMLTARGEESERVRGLATGADDYIVKPFSVPELIARVRALLRRARPERLADVLTLGEIELDRVKKRVSRGGRDVDLGPTEFRLLEFLMERPGRVFTREQLLDGVWGNEVYIDERTVDVHVGRLRKALNRGRDEIRSAPCAAPAIPSTTASEKRADLTAHGPPCRGALLAADKRCASDTRNTEKLVTALPPQK